MTINETATIVNAVLKIYSNGFQRIKTIDEKDAMIETWHLVLERYDVDKVMQNLITYTETHKSPPTISDIVQNAECEPQEKTLAELIAEKEDF